MNALDDSSELTPSQALELQGRCREQTAGTYGRKAMVKACSRLRTLPSGGGESRSRKKIRRLNRHVGSTPISGTTSSNNNNPSAAGALPFQISERKFLFTANAALDLVADPMLLPVIDTALALHRNTLR